MKKNKIGFCLAYYGVNQNKNILQGVNKKKNYRGENRK